MEETPDGTPVGVNDPYEVAGTCDHLTDDGRCRYALRHAGHDPEFAAERRDDGYECVIGTEGGSTDSSGGRNSRDVAESRRSARDAIESVEWRRCPHYRSTTSDRKCVRCGIEEVRMGHENARPLLEEHHLSYAGESDAGNGEPSHEITVGLCRWCHAKIHNSFARIDDDVSPDPDAIAAREARRSKEQEELGFSTAAERRDGDDAG